MDDSDEDSDRERNAASTGSRASLQRLQGAALEDAGAALDVNVHRLDITISFEAEEGTSSSSSSRAPRSTKSACIPASSLEESLCRQAAADVASDVGRTLSAVERELLALELREVVTLRGWADSFVPLLKGGHRGFLLDSSTSLPEDVDLLEFRMRLEESLAKSKAGTWSFGGRLARSLHAAALQRAELEETCEELEEEDIAQGAAGRRVRLSLPEPWRGPILSDVQYAESRAAWWVDAADGLLQLLDRKGVQGGQVIAIDAHTGDPDQEASFSAHYSLQLPGSGSMNIRYKRAEIDGKEVADADAEFAWHGLYEWASQEMRNRQVISMTASCSRHGGGVLTCFYQKEAGELEDIEVFEEQSSYWILAARELGRELTNAGVRAGQVLWIDAHSNPGSNQVVLAAHFSRSLPSRGELAIRYEANEGKKTFKEATEVHLWAANKVAQLRIPREDLISITYASDLEGHLTCFIFYQDAVAASAPPGSPGAPSLPMLPTLQPLQDRPQQSSAKAAPRKVMSTTVVDPWRYRRPGCGAQPPLPPLSLPGSPRSPKAADESKAHASGDFEVVPRKVVFLGLGGREQESMPADDLEACKAFCRKRHHGAFVVSNSMAYFRAEPPETCAEYLVDDPRSTTYLWLGGDGDGGGGSAPPTWDKLDLLNSFACGSDSRGRPTEVSGVVRHDACEPQCGLQ